jgi:hypothetical protein
MGETRMPIDYRIDHERRIVFAEGHGTIVSQELFEYQTQVWSLPVVVGYSELIDMYRVEKIVEPSVTGVKELADLSAEMDATTTAKLAIVAPQDLAFGLGRMYEAFRTMNPRSTKQVAVFRTLAAALQWLGVPTACGSCSC